MIRAISVAALTLLPISAAAQDLPTSAYLPLETGLTAAQAALVACAAEGHNVSVAIVGRDGVLKLHLKADNAGPHTVGSAQGKAFTAASMGRDTATIAQAIADNPQNAGMRDMDDRMVILAGGLPIRLGDALVGGIGVGGAPSGDIDATCARKGLDAISAQ
ncbi:GlcG/HbpS family heme-binding protein [Paracoccus laeviglucosivorans]|uniref:Uncharacterized conserved protein GlcG, DUF336 family n=1 Tax=Paracoccus laeviglucosivorans TaxID=1197861 RepID=A0A521EJI6_9RHOB|nr:heme-binding protein [Paracoccus laeviglucosivorans]SMO84042.1 Uncharacterized conserved protein GlcG, DUF336 family [Paracoccus laeviglucosivorans]